MDQREYWDEVRSLADGLHKEILEQGREEGWSADECHDEAQERLWETIDGHQWIIYTAYNYDVLRFSNNDTYTIDNFGAEGLTENGYLDTGKLAFGALYGDVSDAMEWDFSEIEEEVSSGGAGG